MPRYGHRMDEIAFTAELWIWTPEPPAKGAWHFVTVTGDAADHIRARAYELRAMGGARGFGSVPVTARIGTSEWRTSVFPQRESGGYLLPIKADVRRRQGIGAGDAVEVALTV